jgi:hypothetical protein
MWVLSKMRAFVLLICVWFYIMWEPSIKNCAVDLFKLLEKTPIELGKKIPKEWFKFSWLGKFPELDNKTYKIIDYCPSGNGKDYLDWMNGRGIITCNDIVVMIYPVTFV